MFYDFIIPITVHMVSYWIPVTFFYLIDLINLKSTSIKLTRYPSAIRRSFWNQLLISFPTFYLLKDKIMESTLASVNDSLMLTGIKIFIIANLANLLFYLIHRFLHCRFMFNHIHRIHHEFMEPIGASAYHAHPIEHLLSNVLAFVLPVLLVGVKYQVLIGLIVLGTIVSVMAHVEYNVLPVVLSNIFKRDVNIISGSEHLAHHKYYNCNYGFAQYLDKLFGTYRPYIKSN